ncbi:type I DNA topoisomerase [Elioraea tepidiphila]|jgi:DNA topoisomerase-1|uniref:type I DNA topoisomerase n=1 Tax=Elioraea tepidiphila TaxID=457934 RepID=UPI0003734233|nr:type I DNA topoisomerase [Elioraea tepidiphila]
MDVVVVESPAKAKTINGYLGRDYTVLASYGHVRDLPPKDGSVRPEQDFAMDWSPDDRGEKQVRAIAAALKGAKTLYLATDPDREGEAISWHVKEMLEDKRALKGVAVKRIVFNEITRTAVRNAIAHPRDLDSHLIDAYLARRALDYLFGFTLSPVLWRKLPGSRSAGRVQSVALRLICEREAEIEAFRPREYWTVEGAFTTEAGAPFVAKLTVLAGKKLGQFDIPDEAAAKAAKKAAESAHYRITSVERKRVRRNPPPPFTTSTLQQEASRKLGFGATRTMRTAQQLYEGVEIRGETVGLITYMRTDGVQMAEEAIASIRRHLGGSYGRDYLPAEPRRYATRAKNAQEAHEAIRPTDITLRPEDVAHALSEDQRRLYELIWKRAAASQMASAELDQTTVEIESEDKTIAFRATGSVLVFDGFLKLYREDRDDPAEDEDGRILPAMAEGERPALTEARPEQHFTQPPPRYSEASLVKKLEELGIGRPSTYASILQVLQDRAYVRLENRRFIPEDRGRIVTAFLTGFFEHYVAYDFTAGLEEKLDDIAAGSAEWRAVMRDFWREFVAAVEETKELRISDVVEALDRDLGPHFFPDQGDGTDPRACPRCGTGRLGLRIGGNTGAFIGCSNYPECRYTRNLTSGADGEGEERLLGHHPDTGEPVTLRQGPYGLYVQLGEAPPADPDAPKPKRGKGKAKEPAAPKPKRASLPKGIDPASVTLEQALGWLSLPRLVGIHPERQEPIYAGLGQFGPYVKMGPIYASLDKDDDVLAVGLNRAVVLLAKKLDSVRALGEHPKGGEVKVRKGRFGPYVQHGTTVANLPKGVMMEEIGLDEAVRLLAEKGKALSGRRGGARRTAAKAPKRARG